MLDKNTFDAVTNKRYSEFADAVKTELKTKMSSHEVVQSSNAEHDQIARMKDLFSQISTAPEE